MSDSDDELIKTLRELKNRKDALADRLVHLEMQEDALKGCLLNSILNSRRVSKELRDFAERKLSFTSTQSETKLNLQESLMAVRDWIKSTEYTYFDKSGFKNLKETLNKAIVWATQASPEEKDRVMRAFLIQAKGLSYEWVKRIGITDKEKFAKYQLTLLFKFAVQWISTCGGDDDLVVQTLIKYIIIASNWTHIADLNRSGEEVSNESKESEEDVEEDGEDLKESKARSELQQSLRDIHDWVNSIDANVDERAIQDELLDILILTLQQAEMGDPQDDLTLKEFLQETLLVSLRWVIAVDEDEGAEIRQQLVDSLAFAINWIAKSETRRDDEIIRALLRQSLKTAIAWKERIDSQEE